ncbi:MAG: hypothetical protein K2Q97_10655 [Burkholderiaceae bacterium]|nr:hypothetical protein [Burkholderiaceae bacterium]
MDAAQTIRESIAQVAELRMQRHSHGALGMAVAQIKALQAQRFRGTYADLLQSPTWGPATRFFLDELYSDRDYADRDTQFGRIAGTLQKLFPQPTVGTALALAVLHAQTEALDQAMGHALLAQQAATTNAEDTAFSSISTIAATALPALDATRYLGAWRAVGQRAGRQLQLERVLALGSDLARLTRTPGLRLMLRMMRRPAQTTGLGALQSFLEAGFDTFGQLARQRSGVEQFLADIDARERVLIDDWFDADCVTCATKLAASLGQAR